MILIIIHPEITKIIDTLPHLLRTYHPHEQHLIYMKNPSTDKLDYWSITFNLLLQFPQENQVPTKIHRR